MARDAKHPQESRTSSNGLERRRRVAWILMLVVDAGLVAWGAMAAGWPDHLLGPDRKPILIAGYEGFTKGSWADLASSSPMTAGYIGVLFRTYGMYNVALGLMACIVAVTAFRRGERWAWWALAAGNLVALVSAMTYDRLVKAIGPFELTEYLGLVMIGVALAITAPFPRGSAGKRMRKEARRRDPVPQAARSVGGR